KKDSMRVLTDDYNESTALHFAHNTLLLHTRASGFIAKQLCNTRKKPLLDLLLRHIHPHNNLPIQSKKWKLDWRTIEVSEPFLHMLHFKDSALQRILNFRIVFSENIKNQISVSCLYVFFFVNACPWHS
ncbi:MAG: hypothetical protein ACLR1Q_11115, partial [Ruminococcus sp.]